MKILLANLLAFAVVGALGECAVRVITARHLVYNIEMVKYAKQLKRPDPLGENSHVHRTNASAKLMGVDVSLNSLGNRGPEPAPKTAGVKRVLVLGSSVTLGWGVRQEEVFTSQLEGLLNRDKPFGTATVVRIENAGIGNYNTQAIFNLLKRQYPAYRPDAVVLNYFISDVEPRSKGNNNFILKHSLLAAFFYDRLKIAMMPKRNFDLAAYYGDLYRETPGGPWEATRRVLSEMKAYLAGDGVPLLIVMTPDVHNLKPGTPFAALYAKIDAGFAALGIPAVDAFPKFQERFGADEKEVWIQPDDPHPNAKGQRLIAEVLYQALLAGDPLKLRKRAL